jgi:magnesium transporter
LGGVGGNQTLTVLVRNLAIGAISKRNSFRVILKEGLMGLMNGSIIALCAGVAVYYWKHDLALSWVFSIAIVFALTFSGLVGTIVPLTLNKLKLDPAITSGAFITTALDALAFLVFLKLATVYVL